MPRLQNGSWFPNFRYEKLMLTVTAIVWPAVTATGEGRVADVKNGKLPRLAPVWFPLATLHVDGAMVGAQKLGCEKTKVMVVLVGAVPVPLRTNVPFGRALTVKTPITVPGFGAPAAGPGSSMKNVMAPPNPTFHCPTVAVRAR
jgi:hypothetical protein